MYLERQADHDIHGDDWKTFNQHLFLFRDQSAMTAEGELNESAFKEVMDFNIREGAHGFWVAGGIGGSALLEDEENLRIAEK